MLKYLKTRAHSHSERYARARRAARVGKRASPWSPRRMVLIPFSRHPWAWYKTCLYTIPMRFLLWTLEKHDTRRGVLRGPRGSRLVHKECLMADRGPQKAGAYERPARMKGMIIGIVVLIALIILTDGVSLLKTTNVCRTLQANSTHFVLAIVL